MFRKYALHTHSPGLTANFVHKNDYAKPRGVDSALLSIIHAQQEDITLIYLVASMSSHDLVDCQYLIDSAGLSLLLLVSRGRVEGVAGFRNVFLGCEKTRTVLATCHDGLFCEIQPTCWMRINDCGLFAFMESATTTQVRRTWKLDCLP